MTRDELYQHFGPILLEAIVLIVRDEINILRSQLKLSKRTDQQVRDIISNKLSNLSKYDWMKEEH